MSENWKVFKCPSCGIIRPFNNQIKKVQEMVTAREISTKEDEYIEGHIISICNFCYKSIFGLMNY